MNEYFEKLTKNQVDKIYKEKRKWIAKYLAIYFENSHLEKSMITLSSKINTYEDVVELRNIIIKKLNNLKNYKKYELAYFSSIEIESRNNNENINFRNWHLHIQLHSNIPNNKIEEILNKLPSDICQYSELTKNNNSNDNNIIFDYCIKDLKQTNWELQYTMKSLFPKRPLYTSSRKGIADYVYKSIAKYMNNNYKSDWKQIKNKYAYLLGLIESKSILFDDKNMTSANMEYFLNNSKDYNSIIIKNKNILIKKDLFSKS